MTLGLPEYLENKIVPEPNSGCWLWLAACNQKGYAMVWDRAQKRTRGAYLVVHEMLKGPIPQGYEPDHLCRTPWCVNPDHLEGVTHRTNLMRGTSFAAVNAIKTHCKRGHSLADFLPQPGGRRQCRTCHNESRRVRK